MTTASSQTRAPRATVPIWVKMTAALIVPLATVAAMSLVQINQAKDKVARVDRETDLARVALAPGGVVDGLIVERGDATVSVLGLRETTTLPTKSLAESIAMTDKGVKDLRAAVAAGGPEAAAAFGDTLDGVERDLEFVRKDVVAASKNAGLDNWDLSNTAYFAYKGIIDDLMRANDALAAKITDPRAAGGRRHPERGQPAPTTPSATCPEPSARPSRRARATRHVTPWSSTSPPSASPASALSSRTDGPWKPQVEAYAKNPAYDQLNKKAQEFLDTGTIDLDEFIGLNPKVDNRKTAPMGTTQAIAQKVDSTLTARIEELRSDARSEQNRYTILSLAVLLAATVIATVIARSVTRPMLSLARQADEMATTRLPAAVSQVLNTAPGADVTVPEIPPVKVRIARRGTSRRSGPQQRPDVGSRPGRRTGHPAAQHRRLVREHGSPHPEPHRPPTGADQRTGARRGGPHRPRGAVPPRPPGHPRSTQRRVARGARRHREPAPRSAPRSHDRRHPRHPLGGRGLPAGRRRPPR
ncbi:MAG: nitrate- and nitrite sensing domain-containing protein [Chitinophagaceae bacterium]